MEGDAEHHALKVGVHLAPQVGAVSHVWGGCRQGRRDFFGHGSRERPSPRPDAARKRSGATGEAVAESVAFGAEGYPASTVEVAAAGVFLIGAVKFVEVWRNWGEFVGLCGAVEIRGRGTGSGGSKAGDG